MVKTRAQRKAGGAREAREAREEGDGRGSEERAQHQTRVPESGEVARPKAVLETGGSAGGAGRVGAQRD